MVKSKIPRIYFYVLVFHPNYDDEPITGYVTLKDVAESERLRNALSNHEDDRYKRKVPIEHLFAAYHPSFDTSMTHHKYNMLRLMWVDADQTIRNEEHITLVQKLLLDEKYVFFPEHDGEYAPDGAACFSTDPKHMRELEKQVNKWLTDVGKKWKTPPDPEV